MAHLVNSNNLIVENGEIKMQTPGSLVDKNALLKRSLDFFLYLKLEFFY